MNNIHIDNSYNIWNPNVMKNMILQHHPNPTQFLQRSWNSLYIEWYLHNIGYYLTLPLCSYNNIKYLNNRFKDVDLNQII